MPTTDDDVDNQRVIWGTNVSITESMKKFREFLLGFQKKYRLRADGVEFSEDEGEEFTYVEMLKTVGLELVYDVDVIDATNSSFFFELVDSGFGGLSSFSEFGCPIA